MSVGEALRDISASLPTMGIGENSSLERSDVHIHRLVGNINELPLDQAKILSYVTSPATPDWAERHFVGTVLDNRYEYSLTAKQREHLIDVDVILRQPETSDLPPFTVTFDPRTGIVASTRPNILEFPGNPSFTRDPVSTSLLAANGALIDTKTCALVIAFILASCAPAVVFPPALIICAGPALAATFYACTRNS
jgi:hypothetical protein